MVSILNLYHNLLAIALKNTTFTLDGLTKRCRTTVLLHREPDSSTNKACFTSWDNGTNIYVQLLEGKNRISSLKLKNFKDFLRLSAWIQKLIKDF